jgi:hypothetical protein
VHVAAQGVMQQRVQAVHAELLHVWGQGLAAAVAMRQRLDGCSAAEEDSACH